MIHDAIPLFQLLLTSSSYEATLCHSKWACLTYGYEELPISRISMMLLCCNRHSKYKEVVWSKSVILGASVITQVTYTEAIVKVPGTSLDPALTVLVSTANYCVKKKSTGNVPICVFIRWAVILPVRTLFFACEDYGGRFGESFPTCAFNLFFFSGCTLCAPIPLF